MAVGVCAVSAASIAAMSAVALCVSLIISIVLGAMASLMPDHPGHEAPMTALAHRAITWAAGLGLVALITLLALEHSA